MAIIKQRIKQDTYEGRLKYIHTGRPTGTEHGNPKHKLRGTLQIEIWNVMEILIQESNQEA